MKTRTVIMSLAGLAVGLMVSPAYAQGPRGGAGMRGGGGCILDGIEVTPLSEQEQQDVLFMREEEKLARDVYLAMYKKWEVPTFQQIGEAEQRHMDALGRLIDRYGLQDPVVDASEGVFTNPVFVELYSQLVEAGSASMVDALKVGALIEELDIVDLREASAQTDHADLKHVYGNFKRASRNHLRAFASLIAEAEETYQAVHLTQQDFDQISSEPRERGNGGRRGACCGNRRGKGNPEKAGCCNG